MECWEHLPEKFLSRLHDIVPENRLTNVLESFCKTKPLAIRANTLKASPAEITKMLKKYNMSSIPVYWYTSAFILPDVTTQQLTSLEEYDQGLFYIQNLSSMIPALVLDPQPGEKILDIAAAPGSKTTQIAMMMKNTGEIIANDKSRQRLFKLQANLEHQGVTNTKVMSRPGEIIWKIYPNTFDKTLVDAPCTMEGRFKANDAETYKDWSPKKIKLLTQSQKWLLRSAITATKPGGTIVYSTCTLSPEENEEVIDWLLHIETFPLTVERIHLAGIQLAEPLGSWKHKLFDNQVKHTLRILPDENMEGFFVAKIKKL